MCKTMVRVPGHPRAKKGNSVHEYILRAEKALGKYLPAKAVVHHYTDTQLVICQDTAYHQLLHIRERAYKACGNARWRKCMHCKQYDNVGNMRGGRRPGRTSPKWYHLRCLPRLAK